MKRFSVFIQYKRLCCSVLPRNLNADIGHDNSYSRVSLCLRNQTEDFKTTGTYNSRVEDVANTHKIFVSNIEGKRLSRSI